MKALVTGATGFLGDRVVERLLARGYDDIRCLIRNPKKLRKLEMLAQGYPEAQLEYCFGNLNNRADASRAVENTDIIFHLASAMKGGAADMFMDSVVGTRNLVEALDPERPARVVLVSSFGVYGVSMLKRRAVVNEETPLESHPELRDVYSHTKLRQEQLVWELQKEIGFELVVMRPGVIYGPGGGHFSSRVGLWMFGRFLHLGGKNLLPLTFVENCAEAIVVAGTDARAAGQVFNVTDDDLITSRQYLRHYKNQVKQIPSLGIPYPILMLVSRLVSWYYGYSQGQLPAVFTPYKTAAMWGGNRFDNAKLHSIGWKPRLSTEEGLRRTFQAFQAEHLAGDV